LGEVPDEPGEQAATTIHVMVAQGGDCEEQTRKRREVMALFGHETQFPDAD
jgi:hypothetical protein